MTTRNARWRSRWLLPVVILTSAALALFVVLYLIDHFATGGAPTANPDDPVERYFLFDPETITDAVSALAAMIAAVLGIVITVVSIIVQLSADRYTGVTRMFLRDRTNAIVMGYYVVACVCAVWLSMALKSGFVPRSLAIAVMIATTAGLALMLPYFTYVFAFLEPENIIERIRVQAVRTVAAAAAAESERRLAELQVPALTAMEELSDITSNSISGKDKIIASKAVDALRDLCLDYLPLKDDADAAWFALGGEIRKNPDFVAMAPESLIDLEQRRIWFEWKVLRQFLGIYNEALASMRDICYLIAIDTRYIGEAAAARGDRLLVELVFRYMNSYLRATLNARDVRTAYNVFNQYRLLVESMLAHDCGRIALEGVKYMNYYGKVSYDMKLTFVAETVAYDVSAVCEAAHEAGAAEEDAMLDCFLDLDQPLQVQSQEKALLGVRKAQVKLAAYYLSCGETAKARLIADDMRAEPVERLLVIRDQLERVTSKDFWEINDRGRNFEYMAPARRAKMTEFFSWLGLAPDTPASEPQRQL